MAYTYAQLVSKISEYVENDYTEFTDNIDDFIANAELRIIGDTDLDVFRKTSTTTLNVGDPYLTKPVDFVYDRWMVVIASGRAYPIWGKDTSWVDIAFPDTTTEGRPRYRADFDDNNFVLAPTPDSAYTVKMGYVYYPEGLSSTNTTTWLGNNAPDVLLYACLVNAVSFMKGAEHPDVGLYEKLYMDALARLEKDQQRRQRYESARYGEREFS